MDFRLELHIKPWKRSIDLQDRIMLLGSCFTEHMAAKLSLHRFCVVENPHGILFNPVSITNALRAYADGRKYTVEDLFYFNGLWYSWDHHGRFAHADEMVALKMMNEEAGKASEFLKDADWLIITLGSAFVYELRTGTDLHPSGKEQVVANCHKVPAAYFHHRLLTSHEVANVLNEMVRVVRAVRPGMKIIFTISPVRHHREGLVENNRSKGLLHVGISELLQQYDELYYFPAYELVIDDLRDYRFYAEDLVHPNYMATQYVWEKFAGACMNEETRGWMEKIRRIQMAIQHRAHHPEGEQHKAFLKKMLGETIELSKQLPYIDFTDAVEYFSNGSG
ncbi:MAG TPA: GSCFA domain-containing protein [Phnomibacter sp.]|nr:GSCFA domain-containing protein [Phnomibacter sp.]